MNTLYVLMIQSQPMPMGITAEKEIAEGWRRSAPLNRYWLTFNLDCDALGFIADYRDEREYAKQSLTSKEVARSRKRELIKKFPELG
jgi:hypothetical protein